MSKSKTSQPSYFHVTFSITRRLDMEGSQSFVQLILNSLGQVIHTKTPAKLRNAFQSLDEYSYTPGRFVEDFDDEELGIVIEVFNQHAKFLAPNDPSWLKPLLEEDDNDDDVSLPAALVKALTDVLMTPRFMSKINQTLDILAVEEEEARQRRLDFNTTPEVLAARLRSLGYTVTEPIEIAKVVTKKAKAKKA